MSFFLGFAAGLIVMFVLSLYFSQCPIQECDEQDVIPPDYDTADERVGDLPRDFEDGGQPLRERSFREGAYSPYPPSSRIDLEDVEEKTFQSFSSYPLEKLKPKC